MHDEAVPPAAAKTSVALPALFSFVQTPDATALDRALPAPSREINYVRVNVGLIAGKPSPF